MSFAVKSKGTRFVVIESTPGAVCDLCGKKDELRPYGPNGENVCFECGMKDEKTTSKRFGQIMFGEGLDS